MRAVELDPIIGTEEVITICQSSEQDMVPALLFENGMLLTEWELSAEEIFALCHGEHVRVMMSVDGTLHVSVTRMLPVRES